MSNLPVAPLAGAPSWLGRAWPYRCFVCGEAARGGPVCEACTPELPWLDRPGCPVCALPTGMGETCGRCLRRPPHFDATRAVFRYEPPLREMILGLKAGPGLALAPFIAEMLATRMEWIDADCLLPVPLHHRRIAERGFNQCVELGRVLARRLDIPMWRETVLRDIDTPHQTGARRAARRRNLRGAFRCVGDLAGRHVLVLDDVMTSGATLDELARTLKLAGAARVSNAVVARALLKA